MKKSSFKSTLLFVGLLLLVVLSIFYATFKLFPPLTDSEIKQCKLIASDIYYKQKSGLNYDIPDGYNVRIDDSSVTVSLGPSHWSHGSVTCKEDNSKLVVNYNTNTHDVIILSLFFTCIFFVFIFMFYTLSATNFLESFDKRRNYKNLKTKKAY